MKDPRFRFLHLLLLAFLAPLSLSAAPITQLKVLSFNIWVQGGLSLSNCVEVIRTSGADVVGLQECNATTAQTVAAGLGFYVAQASDCSIVSRYPILASYTAGNSAGVTVQLSPGQRAHVFNCHLTPFPYGPYDLKDGQTVAYVTNQENSVRMPGLNQLLALMQPFIGGFEPCFLVGDFNAPSHLDYANVPWPTSLACVDAGLLDSYRQLHATNRTYPAPFAFNDPGITWTPKTSQEPDGVFDRIDFVYYTQGDGVLPTASIELDERNSINPWPSDHRAVLSTFNLTPPTPVAKASLPYPSDLATDVPLNPMLLWLAGTNATNHLVYFGANTPGSLLTTTAGTSVTVSNLAPGTVYAWRVDELKPTGVVTGDVWSFTTKIVNGASYEWNFANGNLAPALGNGVLNYADGAATSNLTVFGTTDGVTVPAHLRQSREISSRAGVHRHQQWLYRDLYREPSKRWRRLYQPIHHDLRYTLAAAPELASVLQYRSEQLERRGFLSRLRWLNRYRRHRLFGREHHLAQYLVSHRLRGRSAGRYRQLLCQWR